MHRSAPTRDPDVYGPHVLLTLEHRWPHELASAARPRRGEKSPSVVAGFGDISDRAILGIGRLHSTVGTMLARDYGRLFDRPHGN